MAYIIPPSRPPIKQDSWRLNTPARVNRSIWTGSRQVILQKGARWEAELDFAPLDDATARLWKAFMAELDGVANTFDVYPEPAQQTTISNPLVAGANQTGNSLVIDGLDNGNGNVALLKGQWMTVQLPNAGHQLLMIMSCTPTNVTAATVTFKPILREAPADNAQCEIQNPYARMSSKEQLVGWERDVLLTTDIGLTVEETW